LGSFAAIQEPRHACGPSNEARVILGFLGKYVGWGEKGERNLWGGGGGRRGGGQRPEERGRSDSK